MKTGTRIAITGGPGGGKTTAIDLFRRELGESVVVVPEAATTLFGGGFPRRGNDDTTRTTQRAVFQVQVALEDVQATCYPGRTLLCDRGTVDGAAYWPVSSDQEFFAAIGTSLEEQLNRYDAVLFFESAAVGGLAIEGGNPARVESIEQAAQLDHRLRDLWRHHPRFFLVPHQHSFFAKLSSAVDTLRQVIPGV